MSKANEESSDEDFEKSSFLSLAGLGLQRGRTLPPPLDPQTQLVNEPLNARGMPSRLCKRNRLFYDGEIDNYDQPPCTSLLSSKPIASTSSSSMPIACTSTATAMTSTENGVPTVAVRAQSPKKGSKKRKGIATRFIAPAIQTPIPPPPPTPPKLPATLLSTPPIPTPTLPTPPPLLATPLQLGPISQVNPKLSREIPLNAHTTSKSSTAFMFNKSENEIIGTSATIPLKHKNIDNEVGHNIGKSLHNLLKLPKAHRWAIFEWFYSFVDKPLFDGENLFQICRTEYFPILRTDDLTFREWQHIRMLMGKPRRCSTNFFEEERRDLERKRQKIRYIQTRKTGDIRDIDFLRDLPEKVPLPVPVGTRLTAWLRRPQNGIFSGIVNAFDSSTSTYRITFDLKDLGTHFIPDFEIYSQNFYEMMSLQNFTKSLFQSKTWLGNSAAAIQGNNAHVAGPFGAGLNKDSTATPKKNFYNGYSPNLLELMVRLQQIMPFKRSKLIRLGNMNDEAEVLLVASAFKPKTYNTDLEDIPTPMPPEVPEVFQRRYASIILSLEKMNRDLQKYLSDVHIESITLSRQPHVQAMQSTYFLRDKCREDADCIIGRHNQHQLKDKSVVSLITSLATALLVASHLNNDETLPEVSKVLDSCIDEIKSNIFAVNLRVFQMQVQLHLNHIRLGICNKLSPLHSNTSAKNNEKESDEPDICTTDTKKTVPETTQPEFIVPEADATVSKTTQPEVIVPEITEAGITEPVVTENLPNVNEAINLQVTISKEGNKDVVRVTSA